MGGKWRLWLGVCALALSGGGAAAWADMTRQASATTAQGSAPLHAMQDGAVDRTSPYSAPLREPAENNLYFGDLHMHTNLSPDAFLTGTRGVAPEEAYRFAMGDTITADNGMDARLRRPLDFIAITDHAEYLGVFPRLLARDDAFAQWDLGRKWLGYLKANEQAKLIVDFADAIQSRERKYRTPDRVVRSVWNDVADLADRYDRPGRFTALIGYEWTSMINGDNLHRVVLFRGDAQQAKNVLPYTAQDSTDPEDLWNALAKYEAAGTRTLAIAHNGNVSNGRMFAPVRNNGQPLNAQYAEMRSRWEPVYEVTQVKGDGEAHPSLSPGDRFADFETWDKGNISLTAEKQEWMLPYEYARSALREGLRHERALGVNPFKFGMIGSTDTHTGLSTTQEDNFFGKFLESEPSPDRWKQKMAAVLQESWELGASGLAAVWAPENTRASIFDALMRRETYGTTGSRIRLRFFGGYDYAPRDVDRPDYARIGYRKGVPMGGDLARAANGRAPGFMIHAVRDGDGANLDRAQVVKGWLDAEGRTHEKIYEVALSDGRRVGPDGTVPDVGSTVDVADASYDNSIGDPELSTYWSDPDFDPDQPAFYYVRVIEIPRPRWTTYDMKYFGIQLPARVPRVVQDRAYSSPIWYHPR
ncbi:DUF3604 domain-containing protein [Croceicoccus hydrothermalis]|uniref:DUF3604 domain-containing protein n=1 Tax=Croceicoccus hydrothermalis TaxID=2867964 RepID=UPI001EFB2E52|nr:DUF3604 domain-containing protein [Croceicoccus hydrothermalis]